MVGNSNGVGDSNHQFGSPVDLASFVQKYEVLHPQKKDWCKTHYLYEWLVDHGEANKKPNGDSYFLCDMDKVDAYWDGDSP